MKTEVAKGRGGGDERGAETPPRRAQGGLRRREGGEGRGENGARGGGREGGRSGGMSGGTPRRWGKTEEAQGG